MSTQPPKLFDQHSWIIHRNRAAPHFSAFAFLKELAAERLAERIEIVRRDFTDILDYGCHTGQMAKALADTRLNAEHITFTQCDHADEFIARAAKAAQTRIKAQIITKPCKDEILPVEAESCDLIVSALYLHWMNDLPGLLTQMRLALRPDGLMCVNLLGGRSLNELRACLSAAEHEISGGLSPRSMPMADIRDMGSVVQRAGFALPVADAELLTVTYPNMFKLLADIRGMGGQNALHGRLSHFSRRQIFIRAAEIYQEKFSTDEGHITASIELITLTGWAPDASQPKALARGSATTTFAAAFDRRDSTG